jgi:predicted alpha/beta superfamily hydrolase
LNTTWVAYRGDAEQGATVVGDLRVLNDCWSPELDNQRDIYVYLPPGYAAGSRRYPVVYMHDGQNLFDEAASFAGEWRVDETMQAWSRHGLEAIVVGIPNAGARRLDEYSPFVDRRGKGGDGDAYLDFVVHTLKPGIDRDFCTLPDRLHTGTLGSSMGGLISLYALFAYADTFGFAGVMSPAFWFANHAIFRYLRERTYIPGKIYLDMGTAEGRDMVEDARRMRAFLRRMGYRTGHDLLYVEEPGAPHNEQAWARRLPLALHFLLAHQREARTHYHAPIRLIEEVRQAAESMPDQGAR